MPEPGSATSRRERSARSAAPPLPAHEEPPLPFPADPAGLQPAGPTPQHIADLLETVSRADESLRAELKRAADDPHGVSGVTVNRLEQLLHRQLRPAAQIRDRLGRIDADLLRAGVGVWLARRDRGSSARQKAARRWQGGDRR